MPSGSRVRHLGVATPHTQRARDPFLDAVRAIAIARVVLFHTYGAPILTFFVAAMPAMFFCAGALTAASLDRASTRAVLARRFRRLLVPLWVLGGVAFLFMGVAALGHPGVPGHALRASHVLGWVFPITEPAGPAHTAHWWAPLWYLRTYAHFLILSPLLLWVFRRLPVVTLAAAVAGVVLLQARAQSGHLDPPFLMALATFGVFWLLGYAYRDGSLGALSARRRGELAFAFALGTAVWIVVAGPETALPHGSANLSPATHVLVGLAWLFTFLALEAPIRRLAEGRFLAATVDFLGARAMTVYLWHYPVIAVALSAPVGAVGDAAGLEPLTRLVFVVAACVVAAVAFGWAEDLGARRRPRLWPTSGRLRAVPELRPLEAAA